MGQRNTDNFKFIMGRDWIKLSKVEQDEYIDKAFQFWRKNGFPFYNYSSSEIRKKFMQLVMTKSELLFLPGNELQASTVGLGLANSFHPQMWSIKFNNHRTPMECFEDDELLKVCIRKALNLWKNKRGASPSVLRDILRTYRHSRRVSNFRPAVAKALYEKYSKPDARILDFCAGFGGRLLAALSINRQYVGYDPSKLQISGLRKMFYSLRNMGLTKSEINLHQSCAEDAIKAEEDESFELIFTSPPYFDREKYSNERTQSYLRYPEYTLWKQYFLFQVIRECFRVLKPKGYLILNVSNLVNAPIATDTKKYASKYFIIRKTYALRMSYYNFNRAKSKDNYFRHEPIFVFQKAVS